VDDKQKRLGCEEQSSAIWCLADNPARGVHSIELETVATPGMTDEIMYRTKAIKRATELTVQQRM
jgi:hypothetical protein